MTNQSENLGAPEVVLVGVSGGIAAYKSVEVVSRLKKAGAKVHVLMTGAATRFVTPLTFEAVSGHRVFDGVFPQGPAQRPEESYPHLYPATQADVFLVAPATADVIARLAHGLGDDAVTASALSLPARCRRFFAPAMNVEMWRQPVVQENVRRLEALGWRRIGPEAGELACGMSGEGRMAEPEHLAAVVMGNGGERPLAGKRVMVLSGPTREYLDPVRFISNASSGKMGKAIAEQASMMGAEVRFISGPVAEAQLPRAAGISITTVTSAQEMLEVGKTHYPDSDIVVYAAAVADYRPAAYQKDKMPKQPGRLALEMETTPDIAAALNRQKRPGQIAVGFALQTHDGEARALEKMKAKQFDGILLNTPDALGADAGDYHFFDAAGGGVHWGNLSKRDCARRLLAFAAGKNKTIASAAGSV